MKPSRGATPRSAKNYRAIKSNAIEGLRRVLVDSGENTFHMRTQTGVVKRAIAYIEWANREMDEHVRSAVPVPLSSITTESVAESMNPEEEEEGEKHDFTILPLEEEVVSEEWTTFLMQ